MASDKTCLQLLIGTWNLSLQDAPFDRFSQDLEVWIQCMAQSLQTCAHQIEKSLFPRSPNFGAPIKEPLEPARQAIQQYCTPDLIVFGFQEWTGFMQFAQPALDSWLSTISLALTKYIPGTSYKLEKFAKFIGLALIVAIRQPHKYSDHTSQPWQSTAPSSIIIQDIYASCVALGPFHMGNKGALGVFIEILEKRADGSSYVTTLSLVNVHLEAHSKNIAKRRENYFSIGKDLCFFKVPLALQEGEHAKDSMELALQLPFAMNEGERLSLFDADAVFWFGDLNSRLYDPSFFEENAIIPDASQATSSDSESEDTPIPKILRISPHLDGNKQPQLDFGKAGLKGEPLLTTLSVPNTPGTGGGILPASALPPISLPSQFYSLMTACLYSRQWEQLVIYDQLLNDRKCRLSYQEFREPYLQFPPTYKYIKLQDALKDTLTKSSSDGHHLDMADYEEHWPSWCDRILYTLPDSLAQRHNTPLMPVLPEDPPSHYIMTPSGFFIKKRPRPALKIIPFIYESCPLTRASDHKPVHAFFSIERHNSSLLHPATPPPQLLNQQSSPPFLPIHHEPTDSSSFLSFQKKFGFFLSHLLLLPIPSLVSLFLMLVLSVSLLALLLYLTIQP
jgi:hypothetical protein